MTAIVAISTSSDADFYRSFQYKTAGGTPIDLTGWAMRMGVRAQAADTNEPLLLTTDNGGLTITDAVNGKFTVLITQAQLVRLTSGSYVHSLIRIKDGSKLPIWSGTLTHVAGPSR